MKKISFIIIAIFCSFILTAQTKSVTISETKLSFLSLRYMKSINLETKDTIYIVYCSFPNAKYPSISDPKAVYFGTKDDLQEFTTDLKASLAEMEQKVNINWTRGNYELSIYDFSPQLYLREAPKNGSGYTLINKKNLVKFIEWLETIDFGKG